MIDIAEMHHQTSLKNTIARFFTECSCGWHSNETTSKQGAWASATEHERQMIMVETDPLPDFICPTCDIAESTERTPLWKSIR